MVYHFGLRFLRTVLFQERIVFVAMLFLVASSGLSRNRSWAISEEGITIGRGRDCTVVVGDPAVSRMHCRIFRDGARTILQQLGETNPTRVNGRALQNAVLHAGDKVAVGLGHFVVREQLETLTPPAGDAELTVTLTCHDFDSQIANGLSTNPNLLSRNGCSWGLNNLLSAYEHFAHAPTAIDLLAALAREVCQYCRPHMCWLARIVNQNNNIEYLTLDSDIPSSPKSAPEKAILQAVSDKTGYLIPERLKTPHGLEVWSTAVIPVHFAGQVLACVATTAPALTRALSEEDLHVLMALAHAAAPRLASLMRLAELHDDMREKGRPWSRRPPLLGSSPVMAQLREQIHRAAAARLPVLIQGETGTGKEVAASWLHHYSERRKAPFVVVNCAAIPKDLFDSEVFGHEKGAFTGADVRRKGVVERSHQGTLFLDEISELSKEHQARILRVIDNQTFRRVGGEEEIRVDLRLVAASNLSLLHLVERGEFRRDLYHRLRGIELNLPALRERGNDVLELAHHFLRETRSQAKHPLRGFSADAEVFLQQHAWPGNVRELKHGIEAAVLFSREEHITAEDMRLAIHEREPVEAPLTMAEVERRHILRAVQYCNGKVVEAAQLLGLSKTYVYKRLAEYRSGA